MAYDANSSNHDVTTTYDANSLNYDVITRYDVRLER